LIVVKFNATGFIIVLDKALRCLNAKMVFAYSLRDYQIQKYMRDSIQTDVTIVKGSERMRVVSRYERWKETPAAKTQLSELPELVEESIAAGKQRARDVQKLRALEAHKKYINDLGIEYPGVRAASSKTHRVTYCWKCTSHLDNSVDSECNRCRGIFCYCGACLCGYSGQRR
jgi:hypothetical protein